MYRLSFALIAAALVVAGCNDVKSTPASTGGGSESSAADNSKPRQDKLSPEDRALADAQKLCPVTDEPLGSMGVPVKLMINDQPVFICCKSCEKEARKDPEKTLKKVEELKKNGGTKE